MSWTDDRYETLVKEQDALIVQRQRATFWKADELTAEQVRRLERLQRALWWLTKRAMR